MATNIKPKAVDVLQAAANARNPETASSELDSLVGIGDAVDRLLAKHPHASAALLDSLSRSGDKTTRKYVALHPSAPKDALLRLAPEFPGDFFRNPVFDWLLLEEPDLLTKLGQGVLKNILKRPDCPLSFMEWAARHGSEEQQLAVAMNANAPSDVIAALSRRKGAVREAAAGRSGAARVIDVDLDRAFVDQVCTALSELSLDDVKYAWQRKMIGPAQWPRLSFQCRVDVLGLGATEVAVGALPDAAQALAAYGDESIRAVVAGYQATPLDILTTLAGDKSSKVRVALASNPAISAACITLLVDDKDAPVRAALARNRRTTQSLLEALAADSSPDVRLAVTCSSLVTRDLLGRLATDTTARLRKAAALQLKRLEDPEADPHTSPVQLAQLAASKKLAVRCAVAANPSTPEAALRLLAASADTAVWYALTGNPRLPDDLSELAYRRCVEAVGHRVKMHSFAHDRDCPPALRHLDAALLWKLSLPWVDLVASEEQRRAVLAVQDEVEKLQGPALVDAFRQDCADLLLRPAESRFGRACGPQEVTDIDPHLAAACTASKFGALRLIGLTHRHAAPDMLAKRYRSTDWVERMAVARNPTVPSSLLMALKKDPHTLVARQAQATELVKAADIAQQGEILGLSQEPIDLRPVVEAICLRLRDSCRPWQVADTPWWSQLRIEQKLGTADGEVLLSSPLPLKLLATAQDAWIRRAVAGSVSAGTEHLSDLAKDVDSSVREAVAKNPRAPDSAFEGMVNDKEFLVRSRAVDNPQTSASALGAFARDRSELIRSAVARSPRTPLAVLETLAKDKGDYVRYAVASNPQTPASAFEALAKDKNRMVRCAVAQTSRAPLQLLEMLAKDKDEQVRSSVARNPQTPEAVLDRLTNDVDSSVLLALVQNPGAPQRLRVAVLEMLVKSKNEAVRRAVGGSGLVPISVLRLLADDEEYSVRFSVASSPEAPVSLLAELAMDQDHRVRIAVAKNPSSPSSVIDVLVQDKLALVREVVAENVRTLASMLEALTKDENVLVQRGLARNPGTALAVLEELAKAFDIGIRQSVAENRQAPGAVLELLARDTDAGVRHRVAANPATPWHVLQWLSADKKTWVREPCTVAAQCARYVEETRRLAADAATPLHRLADWAATGLWSVRIAALSNPAMPQQAREAGLQALWPEVKSSVSAQAVPPPPPDGVKMTDIATALQAMDLMLDPEDKKAVAAAARSKDMLSRVAVTLVPNILPSLLRILVHDEVEVVRQLATRRLREAESA